jgi:glycerol-3-phosphate dehydrogenase
MTSDVIVIGGGITGAGVLRDLALRGVRALLVEKGRPAGATTGASSRLIHGGLRYLLYDRLTTSTTSWDSGRIVRIARPLLTRLPIVWPVYRGHAHGIETVETLLEAYDGFSRRKGGLSHLRLTKEETLLLFPKLKEKGLVGSLSFDEWSVDPEALVRAQLEDATRLGCEWRSGTEAVALLKEGVRVTGVRLRAADGREEDVSAKVVINAAGPWADRVGRLGGVEVPLRLRQGSHLIFDRLLEHITGSGRPLGLILQAADERILFVLPHGTGTYVGPTDVETQRGPDDLQITGEETTYLLETVRSYFPDFPGRWDRTMTGARPILAQAGLEKLLSREFEVLDHSRFGAAGFLTVAGGKMSDFRLMAEAVVNAAAVRLGVSAACRTHRMGLDGRELADVPEDPPPPDNLKKFLRAHPRLRELHALAYLGTALARHWTRARPRATAADFLKHYALP